MTAIFINEFHYDNAGADEGEFIEIAGPAGTDLTGWSVALYNGNNGAMYGTLPLSGVLSDMGQGYGTLTVAAPGIQNGSPDAIALVDGAGAVVQFLGYEGVMTAVDGPAMGMTSVDVGVAEDGGTGIGMSLQLTGSGSQASDFTWAAAANATPGAANTGQDFVSGPSVTTYAIADAQVAEGDDGIAQMVFTVTRSDGAGAASLDFATADGTATAGSDYAAASGTVDFADGQTSATIQIAITGDTDPELPETFSVTLSDPTGTLAITQATAQGTILNDEVTRISTIQGNADSQGSNPAGGNDNRDASPLVGQVVTVDAIVVGDFQDGDGDQGRSLGGFYLQEQDADADGDAGTSEGIFVFDDGFGTDVQIGDRVRVTGTVGEYFGQTQIGSVTDVQVLSQGNPMPTAAVLQLGGDVSRDQSGGYQADLEAHEGMLVTVPDTLTITEQFQLDRFNEITLFDTNGFEQTGPGGTTITGERPFTYSQFNTPDAAGNDAYLQEVGSRQVVYDDGLNQQNQPIGNLDGFQGYSDATAPSMGDTVTNLTGVLDYQWAGSSTSGATWRIRATQDGQNTFEDTNPRPDAIAEVAGDIKIASMNVLNFFTSIDGSGNEGVGPGLDQQGRGADSVEEYDRQLDKLITAIEGTGAHVIGLVELENDFLDPGMAPGATSAQGDRGLPIAAIVASLNESAGAEIWSWVDPGSEFVGDDAIAGGLIYRADMVQVAPGTAPAFLTDAQVDPALLAQSSTGSIFDGPSTSRASLATTFETLSGGDQMTVVVNHFKSKGGTGDGADADAGDGAGNFNNQRLLAAQALDDWLGTNPTGSDTPNMLLLGDLNSYASEDPLAYLIDTAGFVDLAAEFVELGYSYLFDAMLGGLDYALASLEMFNHIVDAIEWNINSDEADALDYNLDFGRDPSIFDGDTPYRASDHDPIVVGIDFDQDDSPVTPEIYDGATFEGDTAPTGALTLDHKGSFDLAGAEIAAHTGGRLYVTAATGLQIVDITDPSAPVLAKSIDFTAAGFDFATTDITSVATNGSVIAVALPADPKTDPGRVVILDLDGNLVTSFDVGALPDMLTFTPDGTKLLVANEGEPTDLSLSNPKGGVSVIDLATGTVTQVDFTAFDGQENALREAGVRIFDGQSVSDDLEPEYIAVSADGLTAMVTLQEANAVAVLDLTTNSFDRIVPLGGKDFAGLLADFSDRDDGINLTTGNPVIGQFMPDAISSYTGADGRDYYVIANEGDDRDDFAPEGDSTRLKDVALDPTTFPDAEALQADEGLGRLNVSGSSLLDGDTDGDGDIDQILTYGGRSFSILDQDGRMVFDSGDALERILAEQYPELWDDGRSDNKGPEPEGVTIGQIGDSTYAFVGLERANTTMIFDITDPANVSFVTTAGQAGDTAPEGTLFIPAEDSPTGEALYIVTNEGSATIGIYGVEERQAPVSETFSLELLHFSDQEGSTGALADAPNLSAVLNGLRGQDLGGDGIADNTLTLSSGDAFIGSPFYDASQAVFGSKGIGDIQIQNELGVQAMSLGNHEFDFGTANLAGLISGDAPGDILGADFAGAMFPYLSANLDFSTDPNLAGLEVAGGQAPQAGTVTSSVVLSMDSEQTGQTELVGIVGATTPTLARIASSGSVGIAPGQFDNNPTPEQLDALAAEIQAEVDALLAANPGMDKVILLAHMQVLGMEEQLAPRLSGVDVIVAGGSNTRLLDEDDRPRDGDSVQGQYPIFTTDADGNPIAVVNTDGSYKYVGRLVVDFDADGHIIPESYDAAVSGAYATDDQGVADLGAEDLVDPEIQAIVDQLEDQIVATQSNIFGYSDVFLNGNRTGTATATDPDGVRTQETNLGNLTAMANLDYAKDYDSSVMVSIKNGGGIRASIGETVVPAGATAPIRLPNGELVDGEGNVIKPAGAISQNDIASALAFNNGLSLVTMSPAELLQVLEHAAASAGGGAFGQFAGISFSFDPDLPAGERVTQADIVDENGASVLALVRNGDLVADPDLAIRTVTLNFLIPNGDGYPFDLANPDRVDLFDLDNDGTSDGLRDGVADFADNGTEQDAFAEYLAANHGTAQTAYAEADTGRDQDLAITNLGFTSQDVRLDAAGNADWSQITRTFDGNGTLRERVIDGDDGTITTLRYAADGTKLTVTTADAADLTPRATSTDVFDAEGNLSRREVLLDDGRTKTAIFEGGERIGQLIEDADGSSIARSYQDGMLTQTRWTAADGDQNVRAEAGDDIVFGGMGDDKLTGGAGDDTFVFFEAGFGQDRIADFDLDGDDLLDLTGLGIQSLADLEALGTVRQQGADVVIQFDEDSITLTGNQLSDLTDQDFFVLNVA
ncbi:ExeM/NucH family extracellular endonuclease [Paracoccus sp. SM22M-07]|uniref:ExeM/NucH family extracellular endonuclease n=1 Tax=Paracoccus sp. SM22M-07 TaxID=1520813 RepID=UPI000930E180|nr:ExeM/NucH family extracellular endonuclease [Paracoccus sp. SM22M-07]